VIVEHFSQVEESLTGTFGQQHQVQNDESPCFVVTSAG
jgi:hypothetical protein